MLRKATEAVGITLAIAYVAWTIAASIVVIPPPPAVLIAPVAFVLSCAFVRCLP